MINLKQQKNYMRIYQHPVKNFIFILNILICVINLCVFFVQPLLFIASFLLIQHFFQTYIYN